MQVTDTMVQAALAVLDRHGWEMDEEIAGEVREALEAAVAAGEPNGRVHDKRHEAAVRSRQRWLEQARKNAGG